MDGFDCGGHPGEEDVGNWVLLAKAGVKLKEAGIPFVASGGCATGKQLAASAINNDDMDKRSTPVHLPKSRSRVRQ